MTISKEAFTRLPACPNDSLCVVDGLTGSRKTTNEMLLQGRLLGGSTAAPMVVLAQAGSIALPGNAGGFGGATLPRGAVRIRGGIWTAAQVLQWMQALAERAQIEAALSRFNLDRSNAADLLAAYAYVWARNIPPMNARYWSEVPMTGPVNEKVAEAVMRHEREHPGTVVLATQGDAAALGALDAIVVAAAAAAVPGAMVVERTSAVSPALSTNSARTRALLGITGNQRWQAHHLIPFATMARLDPAVQQAIAASGWRMDSLVNLVALPANLATYLLPPNLAQLPYHSGSHGVHYDADVWNALQPVAATARLVPAPALKAAMDGVDMHFRTALVINRTYHPRLN